MVTRIAVMQPYFIPYAGYFRLFATTDLFVFFDCVQFPRRGWVHRNRLPDYQGREDWLTLPLKKAAREIRICDLEFSDKSSELWKEQTDKFPLFKNSAHRLSQAISYIENDPVSFIIRSLEITCASLQIPFNVKRSSELNLPTELKGQERIIAITKHFGAKEYINPSGGRDLYDKKVFAKNDLKLNFLSDYKGSLWSILHRLTSEQSVEVKKEILRNCEHIV